MEALMLSSKKYEECENHDFGDCFICDNGHDVIKHYISDLDVNLSLMGYCSDIGKILNDGS